MHELHARPEHIHALLGSVREIQLDNLKASRYDLQWFPLKLYKNLGLNDFQTFQTGALLLFHSMPSFTTLLWIQVTWEMSDFPPLPTCAVEVFSSWDKASSNETRSLASERWMGESRCCFLRYLTRFGNIYNEYEIYKMVYKMILVLFERYFVVFWVYGG